ncbi:hypothetical protein SNEBB_007184 [Seison nebaliae]|nr:hypothetical protein SNEBB_007184 [Seison nebaliae]
MLNSCKKELFIENIHKQIDVYQGRLNEYEFTKKEYEMTKNQLENIRKNKSAMAVYLGSGIYQKVKLTSETYPIDIGCDLIVDHETVESAGETCDKFAEIYDKLIENIRKKLFEKEAQVDLVVQSKKNSKI